MHDFHIRMRWTDIDQLQHVTNVAYVDYAMEAHDRLVEDGVVAADLSIRRVRVEFLRPLLPSRHPTLVRSVVDDDVVSQEIRSHDASKLFATIVIEHGVPEPIDDRRGTQLELQVRRSDIGPHGTVGLARLFELMMETRVMSIDRLLPRFVGGRVWVVGRLELDLGAALSWRRDPYPAQANIVDLGRSTITVSTRIDGGRCGSETATLVAFDMDTQKSRPLDEHEREALSAALLPA